MRPFKTNEESFYIRTLTHELFMQLLPKFDHPQGTREGGANKSPCSCRHNVVHRGRR